MTAAHMGATGIELGVERALERILHALGQGRLRAARTAWREALDNVDPDGTRAGRDGWLADHFHYWVARGFLETGSAADALGVLHRRKG
ncbi:MAG: hypothetical protein HY744_05955 [Deltaproteobacteria bacterium]|nr:hypothetical protein [Deltaproteobacteria bacterium]